MTLILLFERRALFSVAVDITLVVGSNVLRSTCTVKGPKGMVELIDSPRVCAELCMMELSDRTLRSIQSTFADTVEVHLYTRS